MSPLRHLPHSFTMVLVTRILGLPGIKCGTSQPTSYIYIVIASCINPIKSLNTCYIEFACNLHAFQFRPLTLGAMTNSSRVNSYINDQSVTFETRQTTTTRTQSLCTFREIRARVFPLGIAGAVIPIWLPRVLDGGTHEVQFR